MHHRSNHVAFVIFALLTITASASAQRKNAASNADWYQFRGPTAMGVATGTLPTQFSSEQGIRWKVPLPGAGASSPIVFGDHIYVTSYAGYHVPGENDGELADLTRHLLALDRRSGKTVWDQTIPAKQPEESSIRDHGYAANSPVADKDAVYVFFGKSGVFAFDHDGKQKWHSDVGDGTSGWGTAASPIIYQDLLIVNASVESESLVGLDRKTGKERWRAKKIQESWNTPIIGANSGGQPELLVARHGDVIAFDPATGNPRWTCKTQIEWYMVPTGVVADGVAYYLGGRSGTAALAVRLGGKDDVTRSHRIWTSPTGTNVPSPIYHDKHLYWVSDNKGIVYCAKADTGKLVYEQRLERPDQVYASPIIAGNNIYYITRGGQIYVIAAEPKFRQIASSSLRDGGSFDASPAVDGNQLLVRSDKFLYCIEGTPIK